MNYYELNDRRGRMWGIIGVLLFLGVCAGVMLLTYTITLPEPETGFLVDFGTSDTGFGDEDPLAGDTDVLPQAPEPEPTPPEEVMTADDPDAPALVPEERPETTPPTPAPEPVQVREVDRRALFPGRTDGSAAASQGSTGGEGNQGAIEGAPGGSDSAGGTGSSGFSLAGRYVVGNLPRPAYDVEEEGRVVIRITVNSEGVVTGAVYEATGSTTNHGELVSAARTAALRARFTPGEAEVQTGTITYIFRLN
jgi:TonB family protein